MARAAKEVKLGVLGGSGVYKMDAAKPIREHDLTTPFGKPSDPVIEAELGGKSVFFIPRHGKGHRYLPTEVPYQANIHALKQLGVTHVMAVSAVGIMQPHIKPGDMVIPDQLFDRTKGIRPSTFFGNGVVGHITFADPFCPEMRQMIVTAAKENQATTHAGGAYVCMEGPQFSTRSESHFYRKTLEPAVIGMTAIPEAKLAREAEMSYGMLALATDYDCWNETEEDVSVEAVLAVLQANSKLANAIVASVATNLPATSTAEALYAAEMAIMTDRSLIPPEAKERLQTLYGPYLG